MSEKKFTDEEILKVFEKYYEFTKIFIDAYALMDLNGKILKFNSHFSTLAGEKSSRIKNANIKDFLNPLSQNAFNQPVIQHLLTTPFSMRIDEIMFEKLSNHQPVQLILSSFPILSDTEELMASVVLFRDVTAESQLLSKYSDKSIESVTDPLTGLFTRRYFEEKIDQELTRHKEKSEMKLGIIMIDLDKFKNVNDTYGHQAGDYVLSETAKVLTQNSRKTDILGRYGGEEILGLLYNVNEDSICFVAEKLRKAIESHNYDYEGKKIPVTASFGITLATPGVDTKDTAIRKADECLYLSKNNGRNTIYANLGNGHFRPYT